MENPDFQKQKRKALSRLASERIDRPLANLVRKLNGLPHCFTLQCCYGHFVYDGQNDVHNLDPLPTDRDIGVVEYRIAYVALCVEASGRGRNMLEELKKIVRVDPENVQFGCAGWFWERQVNSYVMQVEPQRFKNADTASLRLREALRVEQIRNAFFGWLEAWPVNNGGPLGFV